MMLPFTTGSAKPEFNSPLPRAGRADGGLRELRRSDDDFQAAMLTGVSRTFALTIPQLPHPLSRTVANAYLLCRIVDTIEDEPMLSGARKDYFCRQFLRALDGGKNAEQFSRQLAAALSAQTPVAEHELIRRVPRVLQIMRGFPVLEREALQRCVHTMAHGMARFQLRSEKHGLESLDDLDQYCYYVAGVVGQMLTSLFALHSPEIARNHDAMMELAVSFGQGLQMTNILKDLWEDYRIGACWLPRQVFAEEGFNLDDLIRSHGSREFQRGLLRLIGIAHGHLKNALRYTLLIPAREVGVRSFCLWAIGLAILTLRKIHKHLDYTDGDQVKIKRASVKATIIACRLSVKHDSALNSLFRLAGTGLPLTAIPARWLPPQTFHESIDHAL